MNIASVLGGAGVCNPANTMFFIPTSEEICLCDRKGLTAEDQTKDINSIVSILHVDKQIKSVV